MFDHQADAKGAVVASAAVLQEIMSLFDRCGLVVAAAHLSMALDHACLETGLDRETVTSPFRPDPDIQQL